MDEKLKIQSQILDFNEDIFWKHLRPQSVYILRENILTAPSTVQSFTYRVMKRVPGPSETKSNQRNQFDTWKKCCHPHSSTDCALECLVNTIIQKNVHISKEKQVSNKNGVWC